MAVRTLFQLYLRTEVGYKTYCYMKSGHAMKSARRAADKARKMGGHLQIGNRTVWTASQGFAPDVAVRLAQGAAQRVRARRRSQDKVDLRTQVSA